MARKIVDIRVSFPLSEFQYHEATLLKKLTLEVPYLKLHKFELSELRQATEEEIAASEPPIVFS